MQTKLTPAFRETRAGQEADAILRSCVHCGFCLATCPTYQVLGDELDSPRGRIYLIKEMLEGAPVTTLTQQHLDRCLTCRACETTCPSGVQYGRLIDLGREALRSQAPRAPTGRVLRFLLRAVIPHEARFRALFAVGRRVRGLLPARLRAKVLDVPAPGAWPRSRHRRRMVVLRGCVQPVLAPATNAALARILDHLQISLTELPVGCCGAVEAHTDAPVAARATARRNIDGWWPVVEAGVEAIVTTASGCGLHLRDYPRLLADEPAYAARARRVVALLRDAGEVLQAELPKLRTLRRASTPIGTVALHVPCTLQHGQALGALPAAVLEAVGIDLSPVRDGHLCCGSAGTYSLLQPELARELGRRKFVALTAGKPDAIATANVGCQTHLQSLGMQPVRHWLELVDEALDRRA
jgi:glycolate oxidase iron-sulfur subunit